MSHSCGSTGVISESFMHEFDSALHDGVTRLTELAGDMLGFIEEQTALDGRLAGIIKRWDPPRCEVEEARKKAITLIGNIIVDNDVDVVRESEPRKLCINLMRASGGYADDGARIIRLNRIVEDTLMHLENRGFSPKEAEDLIRCLLGFGTTDIGKILDTMAEEKSLKYVGFLKFMQQNSHGTLSRRASNILENTLSVQSVARPDTPRKPSAPLRIIRHC